MNGKASYFYFNVILCYVIHTSDAAGSILSTYADSNDAVNDVIFTGDLLFYVSTKSTMECALRCMQVNACTFFTYHQSAVTSCRGHTSRMTSSSARVPAPGARGFTRRGGRCPVSEGFTQDVGTGLCWKVEDQEVNYDEAKAVCQAQGAELITLDTEQKNEIVKKDLSNSDFTLWIDLIRPEDASLRTTYDNASDYWWPRTMKPLVSEQFNYPFATDSFTFMFDLVYALNNGDYLWASSPNDPDIARLPICEAV